MKKLELIFLTLIFYTLNSGLSFGQGCSDAGFCTINSFKPNDFDSLIGFKHQFKLGTFVGQADNSILAYGTYLEYNGELNKKFELDVKLTSLAQNGNGVSVYGLSDIFINFNYKLSGKLKLTLGTKLPLSKAKKTNNNLPLPMDYQSSLGTTDLIVGVGYEIKKIQIIPDYALDNSFVRSKG